MSESSQVVVAPTIRGRARARRRGRKPARVTLHGVALHPDIARAVERVLDELQTDESVSAGVVRAIQGLLAGPSTYVGKLNETHEYRRLLNAVIREMRKGTLAIEVGEALRRAITSGHDMRHTELQEEQLAAIHEQLAALRDRPDAPPLPAQLNDLTFAAGDLDGRPAEKAAGHFRTGGVREPNLAAALDVTVVVPGAARNNYGHYATLHGFPGSQPEGELQFELQRYPLVLLANLLDFYGHIDALSRPALVLPSDRRASGRP